MYLVTDGYEQQQEQQSKKSQQVNAFLWLWRDPVESFKVVTWLDVAV